MSIQTSFLVKEVFPLNEETLTLKVSEDGAPATLGAPSFEIFDNQGTSILSGTPDVSSNILSATVPDTAFSAVQENARIHWTFTASLIEYQFNNLFDVVTFKLSNPVTTEDLETNYPNLAEQLHDTQTNFQKQIEKAFEIVTIDIKSKGNRPNLIIDGEQLKPLIEAKALSLIFKSMPRQPESIWLEFKTIEDMAYSDLFSKIELRYDSNDDGIVESEKTFHQIVFER